MDLAIECGDYLDRMEYLRKQIFDMAYCSERTRNFVRKFKNIIIMGKGNYGTIVARQFKKNEIEFCGFAVSHKGRRFLYGKTGLGTCQASIFQRKYRSDRGN